jgi:hypothetical protein
MRNLLRSALALGTLALGMIGCHRSSSTESAPEQANPTPHRVVFRVPGMT